MRQRHGDAAPKKKAAKKTAKRATKKVAKKKTSKRATKKVAKKKAVRGHKSGLEYARKMGAEAQAENERKREALAKKKAKKPKPVKVDQPTGLFTQERVDLLIELVATKCYMQWEAAPMAKVTDRTIRRWLARGRSRIETIEVWKTRIDEAEENGEDLAAIEADLGPCPEPDQWSKFAESWAQAEVIAREKIMGVVRRAAMTQPDLAFKWLERRYPRDFGNAATRPGIGNNAGGFDESDSSGSGDPTVELESAIASFLERAAETVDPVKARPEQVPQAST